MVAFVVSWKSPLSYAILLQLLSGVETVTYILPSVNNWSHPDFTPQYLEINPQQFDEKNNLKGSDA